MPEQSFSQPSLLSADRLTPDDLTEAFNRSFEGYVVPMAHTVETLGAMIASNDIRLDLSLVAWTPEAGYVGAALLARRDTRSWVGGMGVVPPWRRQGVGRMLLRALIERASAEGVRSMQLEVLDQNEKAQRLYESLGFHVVRPLPVFNGPLARTDEAANAEALAIVSLSSVETLAEFAALHQVAPPWQRERASLEHMAPRLRALGLRDTAGLRAALLFIASESGFAIMDLGSRVPSVSERVSDGAALLRALTRDAPELPVRAINVPPGDTLGDALALLGCPIVAGQREMHLDLT